MDVCDQFMDVSDVIKDEDFLAQKGYPSANGPYNGYHASQSGQNIRQLVATMVPSFRPRSLSARELNLLKRKAKVKAKDHTKCLSEDDELEVLYFQNSVMPRGTCSDLLGATKVCLRIIFWLLTLFTYAYHMHNYIVF